MVKIQIEIVDDLTEDEIEIIYKEILNTNF